MYNLIKVNNDNSKHARRYLKGSLNNAYIIEEKNINLGLIEYKEISGYYKIELIEIEEKFRSKGIGTEIIKTLLKSGDVVGDSLPNKKTLNFWESLGAEFEEDIEDCIENNLCIPFIIYQS